jgi:hypothetical protein
MLNDVFPSPPRQKLGMYFQMLSYRVWSITGQGHGLGELWKEVAVVYVKLLPRETEESFSQNKLVYMSGFETRTSRTLHGVTQNILIGCEIRRTLWAFWT